MPQSELTVLSVASSFVPVGRDTTGGSEQITYRLDEALTKQGHRSIVVGCRGSKIAGTLVPVEPILDERKNILPETWASHREAVVGALSRWPVDLVHIHSIDFLELMPPPGIRTLITLHMPSYWYPPDALAPQRENTWMHGVSVTQHKTFADGLELLDPIPNGVPIDELAARHAKRRFALNIGRICPEKGVHIAVDAAKRCDLPLLVAGDVFPFDAHVRYMNEEVLPRLDHARRFIGPLGFDRKRRYMSAARCVLIPVQEPETSCLVAMEAIACGTPVIAFAMGALAEIVKHGETGFLVKDEYEMAQAMKEVDNIDPETCRRFARQRLSLELMTSRYIERYRALIAFDQRFQTGKGGL